MSKHVWVYSMWLYMMCVRVCVPTLNNSLLNVVFGKVWPDSKMMKWKKKYYPSFC